MLTETVDGFIAQNGNNIYVVSIDSDLAVLHLCDYVPDLEQGSAQSLNAYAGMIFGAKDGICDIAGYADDSCDMLVY